MVRYFQTISKSMDDQKTPSNQKRLLEKYVTAVMTAPASLQLTAAKTEVEFWERHVLVALSMFERPQKAIQDQSLRVLDNGIGNGIPGLPAAIAFPRWHVFLLDSDSKKCGFVDMFCKSNDIKNVTVLAGRSEV